MTPAESLILRGMHLVMRASFSPNNADASMRHFAQLNADLGPWFKDYVTVFEGSKNPETAQLGLATTRELLDELRARTEVHIKPGMKYQPIHAAIAGLSDYIVNYVDGGLDYRTYDGESVTTAIVGGDTHP